MMKHIWKQALALLLALAMTAGAFGCGSKKDADEKSTSESAASESSAEESAQPVTESNPDNMNYKLTYDKDKVPDELANTIALYFYAVDTQNYDLYLEQINPLYRTSLESLLQEQYGYGLENSMEQLHQNLVNYAGTDNFTIQSLELAQAQEVLAEDFEEDTNFVQEYLNAYTQAFGEEFTKDLEEQSDAIYDIAVTMKGENSDGEEITILDSLEILAAEADGSFGVLG
ncbi:MAG: hypothetical protein ACLTXT_08130 [Ruminococcus callidus]